ncbi:MAG: peptide chain release factor N(5)-glutamine methyltransferase [Bacteroidales bacterium]
MKIRDLLYETQKDLQKIYDKNEAKTIAEWLFCDVLSYTNRISLYENLDQLLEEQSRIKILRKLKRLNQFVPIQYVIHKAWFMNLELWVSPSVLIPRPETEEMCYTIIKEMNINNANVLDLATGSGCIAIALKKVKPQWHITATDISSSALKIAQCNANRYGLDIHFLKDDLLNPSITNNLSFVDIIVSNPPYIPISEKLSMNLNVIKYEPSIALFVPNENPLVFYHAIAQLAEKVLRPNGYIYVEVHENFAFQTQTVFESKLWETQLYNDINNKPRYIKVKKNG